MVNRLFFDGACFPNPGMCGIGWVIYEDEKIVAHGCKCMGTGTNNIAEYMALIDALEYAKSNGIIIDEVYGDSQLVVSQILGIWQCRKQRLASLCDIAKQLLIDVDSPVLKHVNRENNKMADFYSKAALKYTAQCAVDTYE
jgi:ribonuclease HI